MQTITIARNSVNVEALDANLRAALGAKAAGISTGPYGVAVHLSDEANQSDIDQVQTIVAAHDPVVLSAEQQARIDRQAALDSARAANATPVNLADYSGEAANMQQLAGKIAWLEQEIAALQRA
jgi:hypothetical protein